MFNCFMRGELSYRAAAQSMEVQFLQRQHLTKLFAVVASLGLLDDFISVADADAHSGSVQ